MYHYINLLLATMMKIYDTLILLHYVWHKHEAIHWLLTCWSTTYYRVTMITTINRVYPKTETWWTRFSVSSCPFTLNKFCAVCWMLMIWTYLCILKAKLIYKKICIPLLIWRSVFAFLVLKHFSYSYKQ